MKLVFLNKRLDDITTTCMAIPFLADERPLKGFAGMADWRLNGALSRQIEASRIHGHAGETVLVPSLDRLAIRNFLLLGLGPRDVVKPENFRACLERLVSTVVKAKLPDFVWTFHAQLPAEAQALALADFFARQKSDLQTWMVLAESKQIAAARTALKEYRDKHKDADWTVEVLGTGSERAEHKPFAQV